MIELFFRKYILSFLVWLFYRSLSATWRVEIVEPDSLKLRLKNREPVIFAHWHGDELVLLSVIPQYRIATITSTSKDGELMNSVVRMQRGITSRGSSTRGAIHALNIHRSDLDVYAIPGAFAAGHGCRVSSHGWRRGNRRLTALASARCAS